MQFIRRTLSHASHCKCLSLYRCVAGGVNTDVFSGQTPVEGRHLDPIRGQRQKILPGFIQIHSSAHVCPVIHTQRKTLNQNNTERNHTIIMIRFITLFSTDSLQASHHILTVITHPTYWQNHAIVHKETRNIICVLLVKLHHSSQLKITVTNAKKL